jgi:UDP-2-acetamido-3-amino-2,3-dideoxy-glucuronate N-acetyltransferase
LRIIRNERISYEEAVKLIGDDGSASMLEMHKGFFCEGKYPFEPPKHYGTVIIWPPVDIHPSVEMGEHCMIGRFTNICGGIKIGNHVRIQGFCFIPDSVQIGDYVFIGPNVIFCNVKRPRVRNNQMKVRDGLTIVEDDVNIGAGSIIGPGVRLGKGCTVGMGAVVTKNIPEGVTVVGCPARILE